MLIITTTSYQIEAGNSNSQPNNKKYGEKNEKKHYYTMRPSSLWVSLYFE